MAYIDDKIEVIEWDKIKPDGGFARATFRQLTQRWGCVGGYYWNIKKKCPPFIEIRSMDNEPEIWELEPDQIGNFRNKMYRRIK